MIYPLLLRVTLEGAISAVSGVLTDYVMVTVLLVIAIYFTFATRGVQFRMIGEMCRLLIRSGKRDNDTRKTDEPHHGTISSFQAFALSIASRVGTGNMAGGHSHCFGWSWRGVLDVGHCLGGSIKCIC